MKNLTATAFAMALALSAAATPTRADDCAALYEDRGVTLVAPYRAGGGYDAYARVMAPLLTEIMGTDVRVANITGAGASIGQRTVANAADSSIMIGLFNSMNLVSAYTDEKLAEDRLEHFVTLGMVHHEPTAWVAGPDFEIRPGMDLFAAVVTVAGSVYDTVLPALAMGGTMTMVSGYAGSSEAISALLRGEVDILAHSLSTSLRHLESNDVKMVFVLSNGAFPDAPEDAPYFAGPGGVVDRMTRDLPADERAEQMRLARMAVATTETMRGLFVSNKTAPELASCLKADIEALIFSDAFRQAAEKRRLPVKPLTADEALARLDEAREAILSLRETVKRIIEEQS